MPVVLGICWGVALTLLVGRRFDCIAESPIRLWFLVPVFLIQGLARGRLGLPGIDQGTLVWSATALGVCAYLFWTTTDVGLRLIGLGFALNMLVVMLNGHMPVAMPDNSADVIGMTDSLVASSGFYRIANGSTLAGWLADVLSMDILGSAYLLSAGDVLLVVGLTLHILGLAMLPCTSEAAKTALS